MAVDAPILVTGAAGRVGGVGHDVVEILRRRDLPVRAMVRREDDRALAIREMGAQVVVGDLTQPQIATDNQIRLPFGEGRTSPVDVADVADVIAAVLVNPAPHVGKVYELNDHQDRVERTHALCGRSQGKDSGEDREGGREGFPA